MFVQEENLCVCNKQKVGDMSCNEHINCSDCPSYGGDIKQNSILFLLQGEIRIDGLHFPHLIIHNKQLLVIPVVYRLSELPVLCEEQYKKMTLSQQEDTYGNLLDTLPPIHEFSLGLIHYLADGMPCKKCFSYYIAIIPVHKWLLFYIRP